MTSLFNGWNKFWFEPQSPLSVCLFRIAFGATMLYSLLVQFRRDFLFFFGKDAVFPTASVDVFHWYGGPVFDLLLILPAEDGYRIGFLYFTAFAAFLLTLGVATRFSTIVLFLCYLSLCNHCPLILMGGDNFARIISLFLCFTPCGERLSIDALFNKSNSRRLFPPWAQRVIQVQLCAIYLINVVYKFAGDQWRDGTAVYYATRLLDYTKISVPEFLDVPLVFQILTWSTLLLELSFVIFFWIPNKKIRYAMLVTCFIFHLGLDFCFTLGPFEWFFISTLLLFIEPEDIEKMLMPLKRKLVPSSVSVA